MDVWIHVRLMVQLVTTEPPAGGAHSLGKPLDKKKHEFHRIHDCGSSTTVDLRIHAHSKVLFITICAGVES